MTSGIAWDENYTATNSDVARELWAPIRAEEDAYVTVDPAGFACGCGGFNAALRDWARFALMWVSGGCIGSRQVMPSEWIETPRSVDHSICQATYRDVLPGGVYDNQLWIEDCRYPAVLAQDVSAQLIHMDPESHFFATVKRSSWSEFVNVAKTRRSHGAVGRARCA